MTTDVPLPARVTSIAALARALGIHATTIYNRKWKANGMPVNPDGSYNPAKIREWRAALTKKNCRTRGPEAAVPRKVDSGDDEGKTLINEERRWRVAKAKLEYQKLRGEMVPKTELKNLLVARASELKRHLFARTDRMGRELDGCPAIEITAALEEDARRILENYVRAHDDADDKPDSEENSDDVQGGEENAPSTEENDGESVGSGAPDS